MPTQHPSLLRISLILIAAICIGEGLIMLILPWFGPMSVAATALLDAALLAVIMIPVIIWCVINPAKQSIAALMKAKFKAHAREDHMLSVLNSLALVKDNETGTHIIRTQKYVALLAYRLREMGQYLDCLDDEFIVRIIKVAPLHDLGKVGISDQLLNKLGQLTDSEREIIKNKGIAFDPIVTEAFVLEQDHFKEVLEQYRDN